MSFCMSLNVFGAGARHPLSALLKATTFFKKPDSRVWIKVSGSREL